MVDWVHTGLTMGDPGIKHIYKALQQFPAADEPTQTGGSVHDAGEGGKLLTFYEILAKDPETARKFVSSMTLLNKDNGFALRHVVDNYDWVRLPAGSIVVDLAGVMVRLLRRLYRNIRISSISCKTCPIQSQRRLQILGVPDCVDAACFLRVAASQGRTGVQLPLDLHNW
jgi:hypothetical protein